MIFIVINIKVALAIMYLNLKHWFHYFILKKTITFIKFIPIIQMFL